MIIDSLKFRGHGCFISEWAGFDRIKPVNLIIGRNNSGKSQLLDLVSMMCAGLEKNTNSEFLCSGVLDEITLGPKFLHIYSGGDLPENHWNEHGITLLGLPVEWQRDRGGAVSSLTTTNPEGFSHIKSGSHMRLDFGNILPPHYTEKRVQKTQEALLTVNTSLHNKKYRHLLADRDIAVETQNPVLELLSDGRGATNIIRKFLTSTSLDAIRNTVEHDLLGALNEIFGEDGHFAKIRTQEHDDGLFFPVGNWEIHFGETEKGLIPLSKSGSGLKTVILVLLNLLVIPKIESRPLSDFVFAFEELENNLHPALLRRLLRYIDRFITKNESTVFLTTHSNVALDMFGSSEHAQIVLVSHDGTTARTSTIDTHFRRHDVLSELGARPSDILQANGIIWVEGPSDVIYVNKWIELASGGKFKEGRDYLCAFYGGALLARTQFAAPDEAEPDFVNLFTANSKFLVVCDSDRTSKNASLKGRVQRIQDEVSKIPNGMIWITQAKEIENYLPGTILKEALGLKAPIEDPSAYERFFPAQKADGNSYAEKALGMTHIDKIDLAMRCRPHMTKEAMEYRFDWKEKMDSIIEKIGLWNL
jgi:putative ATP-dependent endonuclease of the OLD family